MQFDEDACYLMNDDGSSGGMVYFDEDGDLIDSSGDVLTFIGTHRGHWRITQVMSLRTF